jgi:hypothetical protein
MIKKLCCIIPACFSIIWINVSFAEIVSSIKIEPDRLCTNTSRLSVVTGSRINPLTGIAVDNIALFRYSDNKLVPVSFQIDQKNPQGRFILDNISENKIFAENDELVFRSADGGEKLPESAAVIHQYTLVEIEIKEQLSANSSWLYAAVLKHPKPFSTEIYIHYDKARDGVTTDDFKIAFSSATPFLLDSFQWKIDGNNNWSQDVTDMMKIRHKGKFLGYLDFERNQQDYSSRLTAVKQGPLRIIRRTENRIRVFWKLKTPLLYIDYIISPDGFIMDTIIDIPFNIGLFFNDLETLTTMDWNDDPRLPPLVINSPDNISKLPVKGYMSVEKEAFNTSADNRFSVNSAYGDLFVQLDVAADFPIQYWLYLRDDLDAPDEPENHVGQFGNVGFRTTQWENIDTEIHHLKFSVCIKAAY